MNDKNETQHQMEHSKNEAQRQKEQLGRYLDWVEAEGGIEGITHLTTMLKPQQIERMRWLRKHCVGKILECGCNWAMVLAYCGGHTGVDHNEKTVALARILSPDREFIQCDVRSLPFPDNTFDSVLCPDVLEHLPWEDVSKALNEAFRVAKIKVLLTVPNGEFDTEEANSFKHQWLATAGRVEELRKMIPCKSTGTWITRYFVMMEIRK